jgi:hypothetical protein
MTMNADEGEAARKRRLQLPIRMGEAVALIGVVIAGLGLYVSCADRDRDKQEAAREAQQRAQAQSVLVLRGEGEGGSIRLTPVNPNQVVQSQALYFPSAVRGGPVQITGEGRLEAGWFADGLKRALHGAADNGSEQNLPVGIATTFVEDGVVMTDSSLYRIGFTVHPRLLQGADVSIEGVAVSHRGLSGGLQGAVDAAWAGQTSAKP